MNYLTTKQVQAIIKRAQTEIKNGITDRRLKGLNGGLEILIRKSSIKYQARIKVNGKSTSVVIGDYDKITLSDAYKQAVMYADKAKANELERAQVPYFKNYWKHYREITDKAINLSHSRILNKNSFYNSILHIFDDYRLNEITPKLITDLISSKIQTSQNNLHNALTCLIACFTYAVNEGILESNQIATVANLPQFKKDKSQVKGHKYVTADKLKEVLFIPLDNYPISYKVYILLVALTASRGGEIRALKWEDIDFTPKDSAPYGLIIIENKKTKTRKDLDHFDHTIPLTNQLYNLLRNYRQYSSALNSPFLFPARTNPNKPIRDSLMLLPPTISEYMHIHGLRKTANTFLCANRFDNNFSVDDIDRILSHKTDTNIHETYDKYDYLKELYRLLEFYNNFIEQEQLTPAFKELVSEV